LAVQRAKTRAIEKLTAQLNDAAEQLLDARDARTQLASLHETHRATQTLLANTQVELERSTRRLEQQQQRDVGIPTHIWHGERSSLLARTRAAEHAAKLESERVARAQTAAKRWAARWRALADEAGRRRASLATVRAMVQRQRAAAVVVRTTSTDRQTTAVSTSGGGGDSGGNGGGGGGDEDALDDDDNDNFAVLPSPSVFLSFFLVISCLI
jgi:hypothetical protein